MTDHASVSAAVLIPVLGRPDRVAPLLATLEDEPRALPVFLVSPADHEERAAIIAAQEAFPRLVAYFNVEWEPGPGDYARKINAGYSWTTEPWLLLGADDLRFHTGWLDAALAVAEDTGCGVIGTNDLGNAKVVAGQHATHPLVARWYIDECGASADGPGVVYHEGYGHQWCDAELCELAKSRGCFASARNAIVEHLHPFWGKAQRDATYEKGLASSTPDAALYRSRQKLWA